MDNRSLHKSLVYRHLRADLPAGRESAGPEVDRLRVLSRAAVE